MDTDEHRFLGKTGTQLVHKNSLSIFSVFICVNLWLIRVFSMLCGKTFERTLVACAQGGDGGN